MMNASVYSVSWTVGGAPAVCRTWRKDTRRRAPAEGSDRRRRHRPGACRHQQLRAVLQPLVQRGHGLDRVDLVDRLVRPQRGDAREAQAEARLVALAADDDVERDLDDDRRLDLAVAPELGDRVRLEPASSSRRSRRRSGRCRPCRCSRACRSRCRARRTCSRSARRGACRGRPRRRRRRNRSSRAPSSSSASRGRAGPASSRSSGP